MLLEVLCGMCRGQCHTGCRWRCCGVCVLGVRVRRCKTGPPHRGVVGGVAWVRRCKTGLSRRVSLQVLCGMCRGQGSQM